MTAQTPSNREESAEIDDTPRSDSQRGFRDAVGVRRRDVVKAAGTTAFGSALVGIGSAQEPCPEPDCQSGSGPATCSCAVSSACRYIGKVKSEGSSRCETVDVPRDATTAVIKASTNCFEYEGSLNPGGQSTICLPEECSAISHIEFFACRSADITIDCPNDRARVEVTNTQSVYYELEYQNCDDPDASGPLSFSEDATEGTENDWTTFVDVADCEGTLTVFTSEGGTLLDQATFNCETGTVSVSCPTATICAEDTGTVFYDVTYTNCDVASESGSVDLTGETDCMDVTLSAACEGTITIFDDDGRQLDSADFDCETATVDVDCPSGAATICASDTGTVFYEIDYTDDSCASDTSGSVDLSGETDCAEVTVAECDGTITVFDDNGRQLDAQDFECVPDCAECPPGTEVKFEEPGISVGDTKGDFEITEVTRGSEDELRAACFTTTDDTPVFCELRVCVKTGADTTSEIIEPDETTDPSRDADDVPEYCISDFGQNAISHFTIICPDATCPELERGGGN